MRISDRILSLVNAVDSGQSVADIGTHHGYVPFLLYRNGISPKVIMSDISAASLLKARSTFADGGILLDESCYRVGDGLEPIEFGEVDCVIIAGIGGHTITEILIRDLAKAYSFARFVFQPRNNAGELRYFLYVSGFDILNENLSKEGKFICETITAAPSEELSLILADGRLREAPYPENDIRWMYPESLSDLPGNLLQERLDWKLSSLDVEIENLKRSKTDQSERIVKLESDLSYLKKLYNGDFQKNERTDKD